MELLPIRLAAAFFFLCLSLSSPPNTAQAQDYFINCGSSDDTTTGDGRSFVGDQHPPSSVRLSSPRSDAVRDSNRSAGEQPLYQTARVFWRPSTYSLDTPQKGAYILRFHFFAFASSPQLAAARFDVSAAGHMLLPDFGVGQGSQNSLILKEFLLEIDEPQLRVSFAPARGEPSVAFVNAIEVVSTRLHFRNFTGGGDTGALETIYRLNVGGREADGSSGDRYLRTWTPDDPYLIDRDAAENFSKIASVSYGNGLATVYDAPQGVYGTEKRVKQSSSGVASNLTWQFNVSQGATYFVRAHFCDIIYTNTPTDRMFNIYSNSEFMQRIYPSAMTGTTATPFYTVYEIEPGNLGYMSISIGPVDNGGNRTYVFLNGLEVMRMINGTAPDPVPEPAGGHSRVGLIAGSVGGGVALLVVVLLALVLLRQKRRKTKPITEGFEWAMSPLVPGMSSNNKTSVRSSSHPSTLPNLQLGLKIPLLEVRQVTNGFDPGQTIGKGGFGRVYLGTLKNGVKVAVKRSNPDHGQGLDEFQTEIIVLSKIRHRHLVSLIGYCYEEGEMILVYEFMEKGTLREHLYGPRSGPALSWKQRLEICVGAAKGLHYLHTGTDRGIIHRDVKSTNILLDEHYVAKVADFGLSRSGQIDQTYVSTDVKGTFGYLDPEYMRCLQLTEKSDVYSFGVVLLEVLGARPVIDGSLPREQVNLAEWAMRCFAEGEQEKVLDPLLRGEVDPNSLKKFVDTAERCLREYAADRPPMSDVLWDLEYALQLQRIANQGEVQYDSTTDASLNMPLPAVQRLPSGSLADVGDELADTHTGDVFSQLSFGHDMGR